MLYIQYEHQYETRVQESSSSCCQTDTGQVTICKSQNKTRTLELKTFSVLLYKQASRWRYFWFCKIVGQVKYCRNKYEYINLFFESFILKKHKSHSALILYSQSEMCCRFILSIIIFPVNHPTAYVRSDPAA